jgi:hypothetical protein
MRRHALMAVCSMSMYAGCGVEPGPSSPPRGEELTSGAVELTELEKIRMGCDIILGEGSGPTLDTCLSYYPDQIQRIDFVADIPTLGYVDWTFSIPADEPLRVLAGCHRFARTCQIAVAPRCGGEPRVYQANVRIGGGYYQSNTWGTATATVPGASCSSPPPTPAPPRVPHPECMEGARGKICGYVPGAVDSGQCDGLGQCIDCVDNGGCDEASICRSLACVPDTSVGPPSPPPPPPPQPLPTYPGVPGPSGPCNGFVRGTLCDNDLSDLDLDQCDGDDKCVDCVDQNGCDEASICTAALVCVSKTPTTPPSPPPRMRCTVLPNGGGPFEDECGTPDAASVTGIKFEIPPNPLETSDSIYTWSLAIPPGESFVRVAGCSNERTCTIEVRPRIGGAPRVYGASVVMTEEFNSDRRLFFAANATVGSVPIPTPTVGDLDTPYRAFSGDLNGDGLVDLYLAQRPQNVAVDGSVPPGSPLLIPDVVLQNTGSGSFSLLTPNAQQLAQLATWPASSVELTLRDVDLDGREDLETFGMNDAINGAFDQIVYAQNVGQAPSRISSMNAKFLRYHNDLVQWMQNPRYFRDTTFLRVVGIEPARKAWIGSVTNAGSLALVGLIANWCSNAFPNNVCGVSSQPPPDCIRTVDILGPNGEFLGTDTVNVCSDPFHVYVYVPGEVSLVTDTSATDADARETAEILDGFNANCDAVDVEGNRRIGDILRFIYGENFNPFSNGTNNSFTHRYTPGDELFDPAELTYHHYDVRSQICEFSDPNCNLDLVNAEVFRRFTYPSFQLKPEITAVDNIEERIAYITAPGFTDVSLSYILRAGPIKQRRLLSPGFEGAVQNITQSNHLVFPGLITRQVRPNAIGLEVFTHGVGLNRAFCFASLNFRPFHILIAYSNDRYGEKAFRQLDRVAARYYRRQFGASAAFAAAESESNEGTAAPYATRVQAGTVSAP